MLQCKNISTQPMSKGGREKSQGSHPYYLLFWREAGLGPLSQLWSAPRFNCLFSMIACNISMGRGKMMVEFFSAAMVVSFPAGTSWGRQETRDDEGGFSGALGMIHFSSAAQWPTERQQGEINPEETLGYERQPPNPGHIWLRHTRGFPGVSEQNSSKELLPSKF